MKITTYNCYGFACDILPKVIIGQFKWPTGLRERSIVLGWLFWDIEFLWFHPKK